MNWLTWEDVDPDTLNLFNNLSHILLPICYVVWIFGFFLVLIKSLNKIKHNPEEKAKYINHIVIAAICTLLLLSMTVIIHVLLPKFMGITQ